jgi:hypothetical protein
MRQLFLRGQYLADNRHSALYSQSRRKLCPFRAESLRPRKKFVQATLIFISPVNFDLSSNKLVMDEK